eukprot:3574105-Prymnesium_polylepis.1
MAEPSVWALAGTTHSLRAWTIRCDTQGRLCPGVAHHAQPQAAIEQAVRRNDKTIVSSYQAHVTIVMTKRPGPEIAEFF